jgi:crotonobetainyl-CoA:carnitine CoA-transferase CaiB-like acyl-CoA transferase
MATEIPSGGALKAVRILDLTQFLAGPFCTQILGDLGADILKVEPPEGDLTRPIPPHFVDGDSAYYLGINRNKRSLVINLKQEEGRSLLKRLAGRVDVFFEAYRPGVLDRLGIDKDELMAANPRLIWASLSGFGQDGPYRDRPAYDMVVQALSGVMSLTGEKGGRPVRFGAPIGDLAAGLYAAVAILAAIVERNTSGVGQAIDIAMLDSQVSLLSYLGAYHLLAGVLPGLQGRDHDSIPTYRAFTAGDDIDLVVTANTERMWKALCGVLGVDALVDDPHFLTNHDRFEHRELLWPLLEQAFNRGAAAEWVDRLVAAGVPAAVINTVDRALSDPQVLHRQMVMDVHGDDDRSARLLGNPIKLSRNNHERHRYPPSLGQDTAEILRDELGLEDAEIQTLTDSGVIRADADRSRPSFSAT